MIDIQTIGDIDRYFKEDIDARKYIAKIRWSDGIPKCTYCHNDKAYIIEKGMRYKCAAPSCKKRFSVTVGTLLEASKIPITQWLKGIFLYAKKRGGLTSFDMAQALYITNKSAFALMDKLKFTFDKVEREGKDFKDIFQSFIYALIHEYDRYELVRNIQYYKNPLHIKDIDDLSDMAQYDRLLRYTDYYIHVYAHWMFLDFASPSDILSEVFIHLKEKKIKEYNAEIIIKLIQKKAGDMWMDFINRHPKFNSIYYGKSKEWKKLARATLKRSYIVDLIMDRKSNKLTREEVKNNAVLIEMTRRNIEQERDKNKSNANFISHFS